VRGLQCRGGQGCVSARVRQCLPMPLVLQPCFLRAQKSFFAFLATTVCQQHLGRRDDSSAVASRSGR
jgi:hypothetical protein